MTHEFRLKAHTARAVRLTHSSSKRVAVVFEPGAVLPRYVSETDGARFIVKNARQFYEQAFRSALSGSVGDVRMFVEKPDGYDIYLFPRLRLETSGMLSHTCTADYSLKAEGAKGDRSLQKKYHEEGTFVPAAVAGEACTTAMTRSFNDSYEVLRNLDSM